MMNIFYSEAKSFFRLSIAKKRHSKLIKALDKIIYFYRLSRENCDYNFESNGEAWLLQQLRGNIRVIFDVGANEGDYSSLLSAIVPEAKIYAFEPVESTFAVLMKRLKSKGNVKLFNFALSDGFGEDVINVYPSTSKISSIDGGYWEDEGLMGESVRIFKKTGIQVMEELGLDAIDFLKIDVEGHEGAVVRGFGDLIRSVKVIQLEYGGANAYSGFLIKDLFGLMGESFYIGKLFPNGVDWFDSYAVSLDSFLGSNWVLVNRICPGIKESLSR